MRRGRRKTGELAESTAKSRKDVSKGKSGSTARAVDLYEPSGGPLPFEQDRALDRAAFAANAVLRGAEEAGGFAGVRARHVRGYMTQHNLEEKLSVCVREVLSERQLRWSPYPSVVRMLRREEVRSSPSWPQTDVERARLGQRVWLEPERMVRSGLEARLCVLAHGGACLAEIAPLIDPSSLERLQQQLQPTGLLDSFSQRVRLEGGELQVTATSAIGGSALWAPRLVARPQTLEVAEHFSATGPPGAAEAALKALVARVLGAAAALDASQDHLLDALEVYAVGGGAAARDHDVGEEEEGEEDEGSSGVSREHDAPPLTSPSAGRICGAMHARWERLLCFPAAELRKRPLPAPCARAIRAAALAGRPVYLHALVAISVLDEEDGPPALPRRGDQPPPRSKYVAVQKSFTLAFTNGASARGRAGAAAATAAAGGEGEGAPGDGGDEILPPPLELLYTCAWPVEREAASYAGLAENSLGASAKKARLRHATFLRAQLCRHLVHGNYVQVVEAAALLLPHLTSSERVPLLAEIAIFLRSDAVALGAAAHSFASVGRTVLALEGSSVEEGKGARVAKLLRRQWLTNCRELSQVLLAGRWADLAPLEPRLRRQMSELSESGGSLRVPADEEARRLLGRQLIGLARSVACVSRQLCDTLLLCCPNLSAYCTKVFNATSEVKVPLSMQPPPVRERRIDIGREIERRRAVRAFPEAVHDEAVLLQYVTDTRLDLAVEAVLVQLATAAQPPRNPFTVAVLVMKRAAAAFECWRGADASVADSLPLSAPALERPPDVVAAQVFRVPPPATAVGPAVSRKRANGFAYNGASAAEPAAEALLALHDALVIDARAAGAVCFYGHRHRLVYADRGFLLRLMRDLGGELLDAARSAAVQSYESFTFTAFVDVPIAAGGGDAASAGGGEARRGAAARGALPPYEVYLREDHFLRGSRLAGAIAVHAARVVTSAVGLHAQTTHLVGCLAFGAQRWAAGDVAQFPKQALAELIRYLSEDSEAQVTLHVCALAGASPGEGGTQGQEARYVSIAKSYALVFVDEGNRGGGAGSLVAIPPRRTQSRESVFLTHTHANCAMLVEEAVGGGSDARWRRRLLAKGAAAWRGGSALAAGRALLEAYALDGAEGPPAEELAAVLRLHRSGAGAIERLSSLGVALRAVLAACATAESKSKASFGTLTAMLDAYRLRALAFLSADECTNLEANKRDVQEAFFAIFEVLQAAGEPTAGRVREQLELCDDLLACLEVALSAQIVANAPELVAALDAQFGAANAGRDLLVKRSLHSAGRSRDAGAQPARPPHHTPRPKPELRRDEPKGKEAAQGQPVQGQPAASLLQKNSLKRADTQHALTAIAIKALQSEAAHK